MNRIELPETDRPRRKLRGAALMLLLLALPLVIFTAPRAQTTDTKVAEPDEPQIINRYGDRVSVFTGDVHIPKNVYQHGSIVNIGGSVVVDGTAHDVIVIGGKLRISGTVRGEVVSILTDTELDQATIRGQLVNVLGGFASRETLIHGQTVNISFGSWFPGLWSLVFWTRFFGIFLTFVLLVFLAALVPDRIRLIADEAAQRYVAAFFMGIVGYLLFLIVLGLLAITAIGIPLALIGFWILKWLGVAGIFFAVGQRIGRSFGREISVLGAILITFMIYAGLEMLPAAFGLLGLIAWSFVHTLVFLLLELPGVGLILLTRAGTRPQVPQPVAQPTTVPPAVATPAAPPTEAAPPPAAPPPAPDPPRSD